MITENQRTAILRFDTCKVANALERLKLRLRNEGFSRPGLHCVTGGFPTVLGYAVTSRVKTAEPPLRGSIHFDLLDWWTSIASHPGPSIAVIQDVDHHPGQGAVLSNVHAEVLRALNCQSVITNGAVRNLPASLHGVYFLANGFPECVLFNSGQDPRRVHVEGTSPDPSARLFTWNPRDLRFEEAGPAITPLR